MNTIIEAPFTIDIDEHREKLKVPSSPRYWEAFISLVEQVRAAGNPKAIYRVAYITGRDGDIVEIDGVAFTGAALRKNLADVNRVFPYIATCGTEVDQIDLDRDDMLQVYWLSVLKGTLLEAARSAVFDEVKRRYQIEQIFSMNPGSGDVSVWPIEQQSGLFSLFGDVESLIGVRLMPSCLMVPEMTVSGIFFQAETAYINCQLCHREDCPGRRAEFDCELWESINKPDSG